MRERVASTSILALAVVAVALLLVSCEDVYPEVVIVNQTSEEILIRNPSFNGCLWNVVLAYGEATPPGRCLPGDDRVHFEKFDAASYCREQAEDGTIDDVCLCEGAEGAESAVAGVDPELVEVEPLWFPYQTATRKQAGYGDFAIFEITLEDWEQDFSAPGPYGH